MDSRIDRVLKFIEENLTSRLTEKSLASHSRLTPQHFCVLFKAETGKTPAQYINDLRMQKARDLLESDKHSHLSIKEVAIRAGFRDLSHFVRDFEKLFGLSPKRNRKAKLDAG